MVEGLQQGREHDDPGYHQKRDHNKPRGRAVTVAIVRTPSEQFEGLPPLVLCVQFGSRLRRQLLKAMFGDRVLGIGFRVPAEQGAEELEDGMVGARTGGSGQPVAWPPVKNSVRTFMTASTGVCHTVCPSTAITITSNIVNNTVQEG